jgi:hypothetical protein
MYIRRKKDTATNNDNRKKYKEREKTTTKQFFIRGSSGAPVFEVLTLPKKKERGRSTSLVHCTIFTPVINTICIQGKLQRNDVKSMVIERKKQRKKQAMATNTTIFITDSSTTTESNNAEKAT